MYKARVCNYSSGVRITPRSYKFSSSAKVGRRIIFLLRSRAKIYSSTFLCAKKVSSESPTSITSRARSVCVQQKAEDHSAPEGKWYKSLIWKFRKQLRVRKPNEGVCAGAASGISLSQSPSARRLIYFSRASSNLFLDTLFLLENIWRCGVATFPVYSITAAQHTTADRADELEGI